LSHLQDRILTYDLEARVEKEQEAIIRRLEAELVQMRAATTQKEADPDDGSPSIQTLRYHFPKFYINFDSSNLPSILYT
jgi:hypothetical protein